eukprot:69520-Pyramimonas_sp.AAC.3
MQVLKPEPELDFQIQQLVVNKSGVYAAVAGTWQGSPRLALLHLNQSVPSDTDQPMCTSTPLAADLLSSCSVLQVRARRRTYFGMTPSTRDSLRLHRLSSSAASMRLCP